MTDNIKPEHYRTGEIDLYEAFSQIFPHNEYRAGMQMIAMRYIFRDKNDRVEDIGKAIYTLERLKEKEIEHREKKEKAKSNKTLKETFDDIGKAFGGIDFDEWIRNKEDSENIHLLKSLLERGFNYLARDFEGAIWAYKFPPVKTKTVWHENTLVGRVSEKIDDHSFPEVQWSDEEPTKIVDLLATYENGGEN
ncbi:hypothetical protein [Jeotgalibaca porci]|uniref:hypothetical protein n=1 Tax=Jeotgalibaca porci TaxID=1868793 RepID=UPI0035A0E773